MDTKDAFAFDASTLPSPETVWAQLHYKSAAAMHDFVPIALNNNLPLQEKGEHLVSQVQMPPDLPPRYPYTVSATPPLGAGHLVAFKESVI